jgi:CBS domain-containing protein
MSLESVSVSGIMTKNVKMIKGNQTIQTVCKIMHDNRVGSLVVVSAENNNENVKPTGMITERDIVNILALHPTISIDVPVYELMTKPIITIFPNSSLRDALEVMQSKNIRRLSVVEKGDARMLGIITDKDIFRAIISNQQLISSISTNNELFKEHKPLLDQFGENMFKDIFHIQ